jgi:putative transposase
MGARGKRATPRKYTLQERREAVELTARIGPAAAAKQLDVPFGTLTCWSYLWRRGKLAGAGVDSTSKTTGKAQDESIPNTTGSPNHLSGRGVDCSEGSKQCESTRPSTVQDEPKALTSREASTISSKRGRARRIYTPSERTEILEYEANHGPTATATRYGCTRWSIRDWRRRVRLHAEGKVKTSPVVGAQPPEGGPDHKVLKIWREHPGLGPSQIRNQLRRSGTKISLHSVRCVMEEHGYTPPKTRRKEAHDQRYEGARPNQMWHADFLHRFIHKQPIYVLLLVDDFSRFIVGWCITDGERAEVVMDAFQQAVQRHGRPESMMSDGGSAFWSWKGVSQFTRLLEELEVDQLIATTPQVNGKLEVLNANVQKELFDVERFFDLTETRHRLEAWVDFYNFKRTHHALGGLLVPADRYFGRSEQVLASIEAGRPADGVLEPLSVGARLLDLLRVTSRGGQLEVLLMGQRLWPAEN